MKFLNLTTGFVGVVDPGATNDAKIYKTTNKGISWSVFHEWNIDPINRFSFDVLSNDKIIVSYDNCIATIYNGSLTVNHVYSNYNSLAYRVRFVNNSTGYSVYSKANGSDNGMYIYKTTNGGSNWTVTNVDNALNGPGRSSTLYDIDFSSQDPNKLIAVGRSRSTAAHPFRSYYLFTSNGFQTYSQGEDNLTPSSHEAISQVKYLNNGTAILAGTHVISRFNTNETITRLYYPNVSVTTNLPWALDFKDDNTGYVGFGMGYSIYKTTNGGVNFSQEISASYSSINYADISRIQCFNDAVIAANPFDNNLYSRKVSANLNTFKETTLINSTMSVDGASYNTPSSQNLIGGDNIASSDFYIQNESAVFFKWSNGSMNPGSAHYIDANNSNINATYKSKFLSTVPNSISTATLTKSIRDTGGVIHQIHNSMGSIFYSKSTNNGQSFSREEIVNQNYDNTAEGNVNPMITEIKTAIYTGVPAEKNLMAIWQRREGNNEVLKTAVRNTIDGVNYRWVNNPGENLSFSAPEGFNAFPHVFVNMQATDFQFPNFWPTFIVRVYLKWDNNTTKLILKKNNGNEQVIDQGNISGLSVARNALSPNTVIDLHIAYIKDGQIYHTNRAHTPGTVYNETSNILIPNSNSAYFYNRNSVEISLRNGRPVVIYAARRDATQIIHWDSQGEGGSEMGSPDAMNVNYYPIIVQYKEPYPSTNWSIQFVYNSNGTSTQQNPDVEGSKDNNAHLINFSVNNSQFKQFVKIDGQTGYYCSPAIFNGTDAKLVKGSYIGQAGANSYPTLLTLSPQSNLYTIGKQSFSITNNQNPISDIDAFSNLFGTMDMDNATYCYNIGPIFVKNQFIGSEEVKDPVMIENVVEFNEAMVSDVFQLATGDTLILGAYGLYRPQDDFNFYTPVRYRLNLIHKATQNVDRILFEDTVSAEDSVEVQFLRGYVMTNLLSPDSFYVQIEVNPEDAGDGELFGMGGGYDPPAEEQGDNSGAAPKMKVFFENDFTPTQNTSVIPTEYKLIQNYPNPFNPVTTISFDLPKESRTSLIVYDITGKEIARLVNNEMRQAGSYNVTFNAMNFASGIYFYRIQAGDFVETKRMVLIK